jgi:SAM-dependent methyltransferase
MNQVRDCIELLSVDLLKNRSMRSEFVDLSRQLNIPLGWHYILDLIWAMGKLDVDELGLVLDAGAGTGLIQWYIAEKGIDVISVDRVSRRRLPLHLRSLYSVKGLRRKDLATPLNLRNFLPSKSPKRWRSYGKKLATALAALKPANLQPSSGTIYIYNQDLSSLVDINDNSVDAIVSISALEHNEPNNLQCCIAELMRVLKPGGKLVVTMAAAKRSDWFHKPSKGWCYTEVTLKKLFNLNDYYSNFGAYETIFKELCACSELRENLSPFYFQSGDNGMPWGRWDPKYQPVGVVKIKG